MASKICCLCRQLQMLQLAYRLWQWASLRLKQCTALCRSAAPSDSAIAHQLCSSLQRLPIHQVAPDVCVAVSLLRPAGADRNRRYVVHAMNRMAEIFLATSDGTQVAGGLGNTRISLQNLMSVTNVATVSSLVASEPVSVNP